MELVLPPLRRTVQDAQRFAAFAHRGQLDKAGQPYFGHLSRVVRNTMRNALRCSDWTSWDHAEAEQIAWLHDVIEDTDYTSADLMREGFSHTVSYGVEFLTKEAGRPYMDEIAGICHNAPLAAILVKLSDNEDNADPARLAKLDEATRVRLLRKYEPSMVMLREAARTKGWQG